MMRRASYDPGIAVLELSAGAYADLVRSPFAEEHIGDASDPVVWLVEGDADRDLPSPGALPVVVLWLGHGLGTAGPAAADAVVGEGDVDHVVRAICAAPRAAASLAVLLRGQPAADVEAALAAESAVYSALQAGPEFAAWRARRSPPRVTTESATVIAEREDATLRIVLDRPHRHNAINARMRDELSAALAVAVADDSIADVSISGKGPSFSAGGDLDEFGSRPDPATAHITRLTRSPARLLHRLAPRARVRVHGATLGGGIELAAFASRVVARRSTEIALPELGLGLIPGAGGTVSLPRRIGRQRTAALALSGRRIDAEQALRWGLVDELAP